MHKSISNLSPSNQEKRLSHLRTQLGQQQDDMIGKINLLWKTISEKLNDISTPEMQETYMASKHYSNQHDLGKMTSGNKEVKKQGMEEDEIETDVEVEEVIEEEESEFETDEEIEETLEEKEEDKDDENFNSFPTMKKLSHHE
ncbi:hypothetical protein Tco_1112141 [Tanacetum coccineum]|uniref:AATF leucine zipper-containing domain-containing protein n=1 Tax=Tanacetum coccineum TaxID=301880 RepID=A0ABQ5IRF9_9ASTR